MVELLVSMTISLIILGIAVATFSSALSSRSREASKTDAITSAQAALNILSREIGNSGFGLTYNGIVTADSNDKRIHIRSNFNNQNTLTSEAGEDIVFYYDSGSQSVVRYDVNRQMTSGIINRVSDVDFVYYNYSFSGAPTAGAPSENTGLVNITLKVILPNIAGQPAGQTVTVRSDVTLRNSNYMLGLY